VKIHELPNRAKDQLLPPLGHYIIIGDLVFQVMYRNVGKLTFTAKLMGQKPKNRIIRPEDDRRIILPGEVRMRHGKG